MAMQEFGHAPSAGWADDDSLVFRALDRKPRTDTWLANREEGDRELEPWDPDTDDDGSTDGQEVHGVTTAQRGDLGSIRTDFNPGTNATKKDTDGDGYWDGWIGVYDVGRTDNVVLYMEHLRDDDEDGRTIDSSTPDSDGGIASDEIVQGQIETHDVDEAPSPFGADVDGDGTQEHSYLHLGELFWAKDPDAGSDTPSPSTTFEVDYYAGADPALNHSDWRKSIEDNYAMYGIDVAVRKDQVLTDEMIAVATFDGGPGPGTFSDPFTVQDLSDIERKYHQTSAEQYLFVASVAGPDIPGGAEQTGIHRWMGLPFFTIQRFTTVFTAGHQDELGHVPAGLDLSRDEEMRAATAKTAVHEVGHVLDLGEEDDRDGEIYSGDTDAGEVDRTPEFVELQDGRDLEVSTWSVMSEGIQFNSFLQPTNANYTAFSIEELSTMNRIPLDP